MDPTTLPQRLCPQCTTPLPAPGAQCPACSLTTGDYVAGVGEVADVGIDGMEIGATVGDLADAGLLSSVADGLGAAGGVAIDVLGAIGSGIGAVLEGLGDL